MATLQQRKPLPEAPPPPRRTAIPAPANDNRATQRATVLASIALIVVLSVAAYLAYHALA